MSLFNSMGHTSCKEDEPDDFHSKVLPCLLKALKKKKKKARDKSVENHCPSV